MIGEVLGAYVGVVLGSYVGEGLGSYVGGKSHTNKSALVSVCEIIQKMCQDFKN